jgi:hypothetical protein
MGTYTLFGSEVTAYQEPAYDNLLVDGGGI